MYDFYALLIHRKLRFCRDVFADDGFCSILPIFSASSSFIIFSTRRSAGFCDIIALSASDPCLAVCGVLRSESVSPPQITLPFSKFFKSVFLIGVAVISISSPFLIFYFISFYLICPYLAILNL